MKQRILTLTIAAFVGFAGLAIGMSDDRAATLAETNHKLRTQLAKERKELRYLRDLAAPILRPTAEGNKRLTRAYFGDEYACAAKIIEGETAGTWSHTIWNYEGSGAYGLGQARPRSKMLAYGADAYTNPLTQLRWMRGYANERFGGICPAAAQWTYARSW